MSGKYRATDSGECRNRFEKILSETEAGKKRFDAARERRLEGITKKAMEFGDLNKTIVEGDESPGKVSKANEEHAIFTPPNCSSIRIRLD